MAAGDHIRHDMTPIFRFMGTSTGGQFHPCRRQDEPDARRPADPVSSRGNRLDCAVCTRAASVVSAVAVAGLKLTGSGAAHAIPAVASKLLPLVLALGWLPAGILLSALLRQQIPPLMAWFSLWPTALAGLPLAGAIWRLQRLGHAPVACWLMVLLGTATVAAALTAGLLGSVAIVVAAGVVSLPAWLMACQGQRPVSRGSSRPGQGS